MYMDGLKQHGHAAWHQPAWHQPARNLELSSPHGISTGYALSWIGLVALPRLGHRPRQADSQGLSEEAFGMAETLSDRL